LFATPISEEQRSIAAFLDRETARIDALVAKKGRLVELLQEKRVAFITHVVTKGLHPNVPMKDSGVEWLGEVPAHWAIQQLRRVVRAGTTITYGIVQAGPDIEGGIPYIRTSDMSGDELPRGGYLRTAPEIDRAYRRSKVATGDLVVGIRAGVGKVLPVPEFLDGANLTQGTAKVSPGDSIHATFLLRALQAWHSQQRLQALSKGTTFKEITLDMLRRFEVALAPLPEQRAIANHLDRETARLDALVAKVREAIALLKEYRTALISAAVTGRIDVRGAA
jgi:type I restriction enzyme S subunit